MIVGDLYVGIIPGCIPDVKWLDISPLGRVNTTMGGAKTYSRGRKLYKNRSNEQGTFGLSTFRHYYPALAAKKAPRVS